MAQSGMSRCLRIVSETLERIAKLLLTSRMLLPFLRGSRTSHLINDSFYFKVHPFACCEVKLWSPKCGQSDLVWWCGRLASGPQFVRNCTKRGQTQIGYNKRREIENTGMGGRGIWKLRVEKMEIYGSYNWRGSIYFIQNVRWFLEFFRSCYSCIWLWLCCMRARFVAPVHFALVWPAFRTSKW